MIKSCYFSFKNILFNVIHKKNDKYMNTIDIVTEFRDDWCKDNKHQDYPTACIKAALNILPCIVHVKV